MVRKVFRIIAKFLSVVAVLLIVVPVSLSILIRISFVQNLLVDGVAKIISQKLGSDVAVGKIRIASDFRVSISDFYVQDPVAGDTLLYAGRLAAKPDPLSLLTNKIYIADVALEDGKFFLDTNGEGVLNLKILIDRIRGDKPKSDKDFRLRIDDIRVDSLDFRFRKYGWREVEDGVNYENLRLNHISAGVRGLQIVNDSINMEIAGLCFTEHCGVRGDGVRIGNFTITPRQMLFEDGYVGLDSSFVDLGRVRLAYRDWDMSDFTERVPLTVDIRDSRIDMATVAKFTKRSQKWNLTLLFSGEAEGTVSDMKGKVRYADTGRTRIGNADFSIKGLPDIGRTVFDISAPEIATDLEGIRRIIDDFSSGGMAPFPAIVRGDSTLYARARFRGRIADFRAGLTFSPLPGAALADGYGEADLSMRRADGGTALDGKVKIDRFDLPRYLDVSGIGRLSALVRLGGELGGTAPLEMSGAVRQFGFNGYAYHDIALEAVYGDGLLTAEVVSSDEHADFELDGRLDLRDSLPRINLDAGVRNIDLKKLRVNRRDSVSLFRNARLTADVTGDRLDNLNGGILLDSVTYVTAADTLTMDNPLRIALRNSLVSNELSVNSDLFDFEFKGVRGYYNLFGYMTESLRRFLPAFRPKRSDDVFAARRSQDTVRGGLNRDDFYVVTLDVKQANNVLDLFVPGLAVSDSTKLNLLFNPFDDIISLRLESPQAAYKEMLVNDISMDCHNDGDALALFVDISSFETDKLFIPNAFVVGTLENNAIDLSVRFRNATDNSEAKIRTRSVVSRDGRGSTLRVNLMPSSLRLQDKVWQSNNSYVTISPDSLRFENLSIYNDEQRLNINGVVSALENDEITVNFDNFNVETAKVLVQRLGYDISGFITGRATGYALKNNLRRRFDSHVVFEKFVVNGMPLRDAAFNSWWDEVDKGIIFRMEADTTTLVAGSLIPQTGKYRANVTVDSLPVALVAPFMRTIFADVGGSADVNVSVSNPKGYLSVDGEVDIPEFRATVLFTGVPYTLSGKVRIDDNQYRLEGGTATDPEGGKASFSASMYNERYKDIRYHVELAPDELMALNLREGENEVFYGKAYASGTVTVDGNRNEVAMNVNAVTEKKSTFFLPLSNKKTVSEAGFITFVEKAEAGSGLPKRALISSRKKKAEQSTKFNLQMILGIRPNLEAEIVIDPSTGSSLRVNGNGSLSINVVPNDQIFTMNGDYTISEGTFRFILPNFNLIDKYFTIRSGGWIRWAGDPMDAQLDVEAVYKVKTSLAPLMGTSGDGKYSGRDNVEALMNLSGNLLNPTIKLGIEVPGADAQAQAEIRSQLNSEESVATQLFFLLFANTFYATNNAEAANTNIGVATTMATGLDFFTNQIKNILDSDSRFDFGISYRPKGANSSNELEVNFSAPLLENRLYLDVEGSYNFNDNPAAIANSRQGNNNLSGDFYLTWVLDDSGDIMLKGFTRTMDTFDENQGMQESGVGIYYKADFNKFSDLAERYRRYWAERPQRRKARQEKREERQKRRREEKERQRAAREEERASVSPEAG